MSGRLKVDFVKRVVKLGHVFSLPQQADRGALADAQSGALALADDMLHARASALRFEVAEAGVRRRKLAWTTVDTPTQ